ncbi:hypothetical protein PtrV1_11975 [Pyrenophora tritici-repentis]|uniref:Uncharacterized protein n=2 Tax=Pyrenophora tritici-repentis TaxID=45151 RepID=B2WAP6_PYRTR|nr:uncharacterized protein PTRG_07359 [Pyrenophora tritici-repentis Pt-1C-BFP]KAA8614945.1 hypothetical protein PtrV1_11975 [Pyrenophora tritici-repentis]EDU50278.1 conserved hypothetical protein [Pyrenophora tritici-repentis Pt-1C-BFP]KAI0589235.1 hypothetical protein Alg215_00390 [Pyrenophora tritici-repentis]KAI1580297.1 hypothetical protein PtrEW4_000045 [Pyrenophora tritici-repentis]KAI1679649.1 hypothetical protein KJE20_10289 [Pyrenophora tritici-repentis]
MRSFHHQITSTIELVRPLKRLVVMHPPSLFRQLLAMPVAHRTVLTPPMRLQARTFAMMASPLAHSRFISIPRIVQPSFWASMIPKPLRSRPENPRPKEWNPATPYIILGLLVGSQAIQILWLKQERSKQESKSRSKIAILERVIDRVRQGEDVPVEEMLGTGNAIEEGEWAQVLKELKDEEALYQKKNAKKELSIAGQQEDERNPTKTKLEKVEEGLTKAKVESVGGVKFY